MKENLKPLQTLLCVLSGDAQSLCQKKMASSSSNPLFSSLASLSLEDEEPEQSAHVVCAAMVERILSYSVNLVCRELSSLCRFAH